MAVIEASKRKEEVQENVEKGAKEAEEVERLKGHREEVKKQYH